MRSSKVQLLLLTHRSLSAHIIFTSQLIPEVCCFLHIINAELCNNRLCHQQHIDTAHTAGCTCSNNRAAASKLAHPPDGLQRNSNLPQTVSHEELLLAAPPAGQSCQCLELPQFYPSACANHSSQCAKPQASSLATSKGITAIELVMLTPLHHHIAPPQQLAVGAVCRLQ